MNIYYFFYFQEDARHVILVVTQAEDIMFTTELADHMKLLWKDEGVQKCFARAREYQLNDSAE